MQSIYTEIQQKLIASPKKWLITGVAGFIGSHLLENLLKLNQMIIGLDNFSTGSEKNIDDALSIVSDIQKKKFIFYRGDICDLDDCLKATEGVDYILHQAALGSIPRSIKDPANTHASNATGFLNILIAAKENHVKRIVFASSSSVYGDSPHLPRKEDIIGAPLSPYAVSKYTKELYAKAFAQCYQMDIVGLRYFNVFGARQNINGPYAAVIPCWIKALLSNEPVYINGDGETTRDFCYIDNAVQANILAATTSNKQAINTIYNIAAHKQNSLNRLYQLLIKILGLDTKPIYREQRLGDVRHSLADITRAQTLLGYIPINDFESCIANTVRWYNAKKETH